MKRYRITMMRIFGYQIQLLIFILFLLNSNLGFSQDLFQIKKERSQMAFNRAVTAYKAEIGKNSMIYTGSSYHDPYDGIKGHQYFFEDYWESGQVVYDGNTYDSIFLMYDIVGDLLLIENFNSNGYLSPVKLYSPKVESFDIHGYHFIRLERDTISDIKEGFYNLMFDRPGLQVVVKRRKEIINSNDIGTIREQFTERNRYYIVKNGVFYQVRKRKSILKVLNDHKKELKVFMKDNNFFFRNQPDIQLVEVVKYYDSLI